MSAPMRVHPFGCASATSRTAAHKRPSVPWSGSWIGWSAVMRVAFPPGVELVLPQPPTGADGAGLAGLDQVEGDDGCGGHTGLVLGELAGLDDADDQVGDANRDLSVCCEATNESFSRSKWQVDLQRAAIADIDRRSSAEPSPISPTGQPPTDRPSGDHRVAQLHTEGVRSAAHLLPRADPITGLRMLADRLPPPVLLAVDSRSKEEPVPDDVAYRLIRTFRWPVLASAGT